MEPEKHPCETCGRVFTAKITLRQHMITHTEDKPFTCEFCGKSFRSRDSYLGKEFDLQIEYSVQKKHSYPFRPYYGLHRKPRKPWVQFPVGATVLFLP